MNKEFSYICRTTRKRLGLTRKQFANLLCVKLGTLDSWEYKYVVPNYLIQNIVFELSLAKNAKDNISETNKARLNLGFPVFPLSALYRIMRNK